jgi:hypothetical protein
LLQSGQNEDLGNCAHYEISYAYFVREHDPSRLSSEEGLAALTMASNTQKV